MNLLAIYEAAVDRGDIKNDIRQRDLLTIMQHLADDLKSNGLLHRLSRKNVQGLYIYGTVGAGKTYLMDLFFNYAPVKRKLRTHFHDFMQKVDAELRHRQGQANPLKTIAQELSKAYRLLCLDEFMVHDIAQAMILNELLTLLFEHGVVLVTTSNTEPDRLYWNGLQRDRFLPAIAQIKTHCQVIHFGVETDYRLGRTSDFTTWLSPLSATNEQKLLQQFIQLEPTYEENGNVLIQKRWIDYRYCGKHTIWFDFDILCSIPRSQLDYLEIAQRFETIFVSNVPSLMANEPTSTILMTHFIDVMYNHGIRVVFLAMSPLDHLPPPGEMNPDFKRTYSRLQEMQSLDYLAHHTRKIF